MNGLGKLVLLFSQALRATAAPGRLIQTAKAEPRQRLKPAIVGGNWKGIEYLTYAEHDACTRYALQAARSPNNKPKAAYEVARQRLIIERKH